MIPQMVILNLVKYDPNKELELTWRYF